MSDFIIVGGTLIDGTGRGPQEGMAVVVEGGRISAVLPKAEAERLPGTKTARRIDGTGKYVLPGLINMHEHLTLREVIGPPEEPGGVMTRGPVELAVIAAHNALVALRRGWTTVCDMGSSHGVSLTIRDLINRREISGPRVLTCGSPISMTGGHGYQVCVEADGPDACRKAAREQLKAGADLIKVMASHDPYPMKGTEQSYPQLGLDEIRVAFEEAHKRGKKTAAHAVHTTAIANVLDAGIDMLQHGIYLNKELAKRMVQSGTYYCPTLSGYDRQTMNPKYRRGEAWAKAHSALVKPHEEAIVAALTAGVKIVTGTDTTGVYTEEVQLMRDAGMSSMDTIRACTLTAAEALGLEKEIGSIEAGKVADVVLLDGDPLIDVMALAQVHMVMRGGVLLDPREITL